MSRARLIAALALALFLRWLAVGHVALSVAGATVTIPALLIAATAVIAAAGALVALAVALNRPVPAGTGTASPDGGPS